jgi:hypothetical protein
LSPIAEHRQQTTTHHAIKQAFYFDSVAHSRYGRLTLPQDRLIDQVFELVPDRFVVVASCDDIHVQPNFMLICETC